MGERLRIARHQCVHILLEPIEQRGVSEQPMFDHLGEPRREFAVGQRGEAERVSEHRHRLMKGTDHVLAARVIDRGLAAY